MELMTVIVVVCILSVMALAAVAGLQGKAERGRCINNLQGLYAAGVSYVTDQGMWPQIPANDVEDPAFARAWMTAFKPYNIGSPNWKCATVQKLMGNPPDDPNYPAIDYIPTSFDSKPGSPWLYSTHPWFIERSDAHGSGNLIILTNGQIRTLNEFGVKK